MRVELNVCRVDPADDLRLRESQQVVVARLLAMVVAEAVTVVVVLLELVALDHGAHGTVEHQDATAQQFAQEVGTVRLQVRPVRKRKTRPLEGTGFAVTL